MSSLPGKTCTKPTAPLGRVSSLHTSNSFYSARAENSLLAFFDGGDVLAKRFDDKEKSFKERSSAKRYENTKALLLAQGTAKMSSCVAERRFRAELHWKTGSRTGIAMLLVTRAWSPLTRSVCWENLETMYFVTPSTKEGRFFCM